MSSPQISVQLYSVRDAVGADLPAALARLREIGLEAVEPYGLGELAASYREALPGSGLAAPSAHAALIGGDGGSPEQIAAALDAAEALGITVLIEPAAREGWDSREGVRALAARLNAVAAQAAERGITIGYHNHWWEFADFDGVTALEVFAAALDPEIVLELDAYWAEVGGVPAVPLLERLGERVRFLHVKDGPIGEDTRLQLPAGEGAMDIPALLAAAPRALRVLEFDDFDGDVYEGLARSLAAVRAIDAGAGR